MNDLAELVEQLLSGPRPLPLVRAGAPILRTPAAPYDFSLPSDLWTALIAAMRQTMHHAPGVGLAAPQIGLAVAVAVIEDAAAVAPEIAAARERYRTAPRVLVNPRYEPVISDSLNDEPGTAMPTASFYEGCLSVPGYQAVVKRAKTVRLRCSDANEEPVDELVHGWAARIVAHETDHLEGILYLDRAIIRSISTSENLLDLWSGSSMSVIRQSLDF